MIGSRRPVSDELLLCIAMPVVDDMTLAPLRTRLLTPESTTYAEPRIDDYADRREAHLKWWRRPVKVANPCDRHMRVGGVASTTFPTLTSSS